MSSPWTPTSIPDLTGRVAIVTGGNTGIGKAMVLELALHNAKVYMAARTESRALAAIEELKAEHDELIAKDNIRFLKLDLTDLKGCKEAAEEFMRREDRLDILINNAGVMATPYELTADGFELQFQSNHLGHFAFTLLLVPLLIKTSKDPDSSVRVVQVSAKGHEFAEKDVRFDSIESVNKNASPLARYGQSKLANILFAKQLAHYFKDERIFSNAAHPGEVNTEISRGALESWPLLKPVVWLSQFIFKTPYQGATTPLFAACADEIESNNWRGEYFVPMAQLGQPSAQAQNAKLAEDLWDFSRKVVEERIGKLPI